MSQTVPRSSLSQESLEQILEVARNLASTFDIETILSQIVDAGRFILQANRVAFYMHEHETNELVMKIAAEGEPPRFPVGRGLAGHCAESRKMLNVPDCEADPRFDPEVDQKAGYVPSNLLAVPLIGFGESLVGVLHLFDKVGGPFGEEDERVASWLAAQSAVALQRLRLTEAMVSARKLDQEINVARQVQMGTLPRDMPEIDGYDIAGTFVPTDHTGGDTFDLVAVEQRQLMILLADATGHGIGPALSATQVRAMLRVALRLGADLDATFVHINNQLVEDLPEGHFVTAFLGLLDADAHQVRFHSGGQGPIMHYRYESDDFQWHEPSTYPMGFSAQTDLEEARCVDMQPGDILGLISDGIYEYENDQGDQFGMGGVADVVRQHRDTAMDELVNHVLSAARDYGGSAPQFDDITIVLLRRVP